MFDISKAGDISILHLYGEISLLELDLVEKLITSLKKTSHRKILLDLARVDYVHFQAVRQWASEALALRSLNGDLKLVSPNQQTRLVIQFTGADQYLKDYANVGEALLSFLRMASPILANNQSVAEGRKNYRAEAGSELSEDTQDRDPGVILH